MECEVSMQLFLIIVNVCELTQIIYLLVAQAALLYGDHPDVGKFTQIFELGESVWTPFTFLNTLNSAHPSTLLQDRVR